MLEFFRMIGDTIVTFAQMVINIVYGLVQFVLMLPKVLTFSAFAASFVPTFLISFFTASIIITVVVVLINRKG